MDAPDLLMHLLTKAKLVPCAQRAKSLTKLPRSPYSILPLNVRTLQELLIISSVNTHASQVWIQSQVLVALIKVRNLKMELILLLTLLEAWMTKTWMVMGWPLTRNLWTGTVKP